VRCGADARGGWSRIIADTYVYDYGRLRTIPCCSIVGLTLVVVVAFGADRQLVGTLAVDVVHGGLLTDELVTALSVALTVSDTAHALTRLHKHTLRPLCHIQQHAEAVGRIL